MKDQPIITVFCAFTRRWAVERWIKDFEAIDLVPENTNLCFIVDADEPFIATRLRQMSERKPYRSFEVVTNRDHQPNEARIHMRRLRIADIKNQSKKLIADTDGKYIVCLEDDTIFGKHKNMLERLLTPLITYPRVAFVEGVQCGRWGVKMIGAWIVDKYNFPTKAHTMLPPKQRRDNDFDGAIADDPNYEYIDAGGFYGYATHRDLYLNHEYYASAAQQWGPDVNFGLWVDMQGLKCLIDWSLDFGHQDYSKIGWPDTNIAEVRFVKNLTTGQWNREPDVEISGN